MKEKIQTKEKRSVELPEAIKQTGQLPCSHSINNVINEMHWPCWIFVECDLITPTSIHATPTSIQASFC